MSKKKLLLRDDCCLHIIDPQEALLNHIINHEKMIKNIMLVINCLKVLKLPIVANTQYKKGLGDYPDQLQSILTDVEVIDKIEFNCLASEGTSRYYDELPERISTPILMGVETHICVYQTALGLIQRGLHPWVVSDAVSSRDFENHNAGLRRLEQLGCSVGPAEMIIYELLYQAGTPEFKAILPLITQR